ncbi:hypothetical protein PMIN06_008968 [Paraphaeosphaeria minitans]
MGSPWPQGSVWNAREGLEVAVNAIGDIPASSHVHSFSLKVAYTAPARPSKRIRMAHARLLAMSLDHSSSAIQLDKTFGPLAMQSPPQPLQAGALLEDVKVDPLA